MKKLILILLGVLSSQAILTASEIDSLLNQLEQVMEKRESFQATKELEINSMKALLKEAYGNPEQTYYIKNQIIKAYIPFKFDSTLSYINSNLDAAKKLNNIEMLNETRLHLSIILASSGQYKESLDILSEIKRSSLQKELLDEYYANYWKVYAELSYYTRARETKKAYEDMYKAYDDSLRQTVSPSSETYLMTIEKKLRDSRQVNACLDINTKRLAQATMGTRTYSLVTFERAINYEILNNVEQQKKFLILSAISDIKSAIKDNASLTSLAMILHKENDIERPHKYIQFAFDDAVFFNSRLRFIEISNTLPLINHAYQLKTDSQNKQLRASLITISILSAIILLAFIFIYRQMKNLSTARTDLENVNLQLKALNNKLNNANNKLSGLNLELAESNHVKEQYIGNFISICSNYIDKLDNYRKLVNKQIAAHKITELFDLTKSRSLIDEELKEFYENFDNTFLNIYPNFVEEFNAMLVEEERIELKKGELLNTELRIFALIRLGINDSSQIAGLLRYSVNTIYNYRVKIKNRSIVPREEFEDLVMKIGVFTK